MNVLKRIFKGRSKDWFINDRWLFEISLFDYFGLGIIFSRDYFEIQLLIFNVSLA